MKYNLSELKFLQGRSIVIFGSSVGGSILSDYLRKNNFNPLCFSDNDTVKWGRKFCGKKIIPPNEIPKDSLVLIASNWAHEISLQLNTMNIENVDLTCWDDRWRVNFDINKLSTAKQEQQAIRALFQDEESKNVWDAYLKYRHTADASILIPSQYAFYGHPKVSVSQGDIVFDVGSYDGETAKFFLESGASKVYAFEPDSSNYNLVCKNIKLWNKPNIIALNYGFWNEKATLSFTEDSLHDTQKSLSKEQKTGSAVNTKIKVTSIDSFISEIDEMPTLIKMDIEGAELNALLGAKELLKKEKPKLQISVYHEWDDLWKIPALIKNINSDYKFYLSHHQKNLFELVLYAR
tara:strand:+ start:985 stop:2031 length:1047 start_codon:yes stop_codon:yes gene_type:complete